jgi:hypothetical protein
MYQTVLAIAIVLMLVLNEIAFVVITIRHIRRIQQREDEDDDESGGNDGAEIRFAIIPPALGMLAIPRLASDTASARRAISP